MLGPSLRMQKKLEYPPPPPLGQIRAERSVFGQHGLLSIGHDVDFELTLPFFWDLYHGNCQLLIEFPPKLISPNFCKACNHTLNQHWIGHVVLHITLMLMPYYRA